MDVPADPLAIDLRQVSKTYRGGVQALRGMALRVHRGEIFGLLGPNGAGKTTLVKILMTVIHPTRAAGALLGRPLGHKPTLGRVGYLPENHRFPVYLTGRQALEYYAALAQVDRLTRRRRTGELLELVGMTAAADRKVGTYSKGMMQRIGLAQALVNDPDLVVLDEPTDGVDPVGRRDIRQILLHLRMRAKTVFLNSHLLGEVETVCDRVAILVRGQVARQGTLDDLSVGQAHYEVELLSADGLSAATVRRDDLPVTLEGATLRLGTADPAAVQPVLDALRARQLVVKTLRLVRPSLEDLFMEAVRSS